MTTHIIGMGALGTLFGYQIAQKRGLESVAFVMDQNRLAKCQNTPVFVNGTVVPFPMITPDMASPADLVIVAVKGPGLEASLNTIQNSVGPDTIIISLLNGIVNFGTHRSHERVVGLREPCAKFLAEKYTLVYKFLKFFLAFAQNWLGGFVLSVKIGNV